MKRIVLMTQTFGNPGEQCGTWYDLGHHEMRDLIKSVAAKCGKSPEDIADVCLTASEWDEINEKLFRLEGLDK